METRKLTTNAQLNEAKGKVCRYDLLLAFADKQLKRFYGMHRDPVVATYFGLDALRNPGLLKREGEITGYEVIERETGAIVGREFIVNFDERCAREFPDQTDNDLAFRLQMHGPIARDMTAPSWLRELSAAYVELIAAELARRDSERNSDPVAA